MTATVGDGRSGWAELTVDGDQSFGRLLKRYRRAAHLTQEALAERAGYSAHYVSMLERGVRFPQPLTVDLLADALVLPELERRTLHRSADAGRPEVKPYQGLALPPIQLIGREHEIAQVVRLLGDDGVRLLTLTGPGGVGKTALAQHVARAVAPAFRDGVTSIDLATMSDAADVIPAIARALAVRAMGRRSIRERLSAFLHERDMLLVLDSFERVIDAAAPVGMLLASCPRIRFLITSRAPLRLRTEYEVRLQPLALPHAGHLLPADQLLQYAAVALFVQRAMLVKPDLAIDDAQAALVADICRRLDGLPLAIELAAARLTHLPLVTLHDRLQHRLQILTGGPRDLPARQQRMRDTIAWSDSLLTHANQALLRQLSVFAGSWSLEAAETVCLPRTSADDLLDGLRSLVENSLIVAMDDVPDEPRYRMLDTIHEYAAEQLAASGELDVLRQRHSAYYVHLAEQAEPALQDRDQRVWYPRLEREHANLRATLDWLLRAGDAALALRLAGAVWRFWQRHGDIREGREWLEAALAKAEHVPEEVRAKALWGASWLAYHQGDYAQMSALSSAYLTLARERGDALSIRNALTGLGMAALAEGRSAEAVLHLQEALDICLPLGNVWHRATSFLNLGNATMLAGDLPRAATLFEKALALYQERGDEVFTARVDQHLGYVALLQGHYTHTETLFAQSLQTLVDLGEKPGIADGLEAAAALRAATGDARQAGQLAAAAAVLRESIGAAPLPYLRALWQPFVARAAERLGAQAWATAREGGRAMALHEAVATALGADT